MPVDHLIERARRNAIERLSGLQLDSPAYAVALFSSDPDLLYGTAITVGLERDRAVALQALALGEARFLIWSAAEFGAVASDTPKLVYDPSFANAQIDVRATLTSRGIWDVQRYVLNRIAAQIPPSDLTFTVTADFVAYVGVNKARRYEGRTYGSQRRQPRLRRSRTKD